MITRETAKKELEELRKLTTKEGGKMPKMMYGGKMKMKMKHGGKAHAKKNK